MMVALSVGVGLVVFGLLWSTREPVAPLRPVRPARNHADEECLAMWNPPEGGI